MPGRFIVLSHGRTGSTYLVDSLNRHPKITMFSELFHPSPDNRQLAGGRVWKDGEDSVRFLEETVFPAGEADGLVGFKLFYFHARSDALSRRVWDMIAADPALPLVLLHRRNVFAGHVSEQRAHQSKVWHPNRGADYHRRQELTLDVEAARRYVQNVRAMQEAGRDLARDHPALEIFYEDFAADAPAVLGRLIDFLGLARVGTWPEFSSGSADVRATRILNLEECRCALDEIGAGWMADPYETPLP